MHYLTISWIGVFIAIILWGLWEASNTSVKDKGDLICTYVFIGMAAPISIPAIIVFMIGELIFNSMIKLRKKLEARKIRIAPVIELKSKSDDELIQDVELMAEEMLQSSEEKQESSLVN